MIISCRESPCVIDCITENCANHEIHCGDTKCVVDCGFTINSNNHHDIKDIIKSNCQSLQICSQNAQNLDISLHYLHNNKDHDKNTVTVYDFLANVFNDTRIYAPLNDKITVNGDHMQNWFDRAPNPKEILSFDFTDFNNNKYSDNNSSIINSNKDSSDHHQTPYWLYFYRNAEGNHSGMATQAIHKQMMPEQQQQHTTQHTKTQQTSKNSAKNAKSAKQFLQKMPKLTNFNDFEDRRGRGGSTSSYYRRLLNDSGGSGDSAEVDELFCLNDGRGCIIPMELWILASILVLVLIGLLMYLCYKCKRDDNGGSGNSENDTRNSLMMKENTNNNSGKSGGKVEMANNLNTGGIGGGDDAQAIARMESADALVSGAGGAKGSGSGDNVTYLSDEDDLEAHDDEEKAEEYVTPGGPGDDPPTGDNDMNNGGDSGDGSGNEVDMNDGGLAAS